MSHGIRENGDRVSHTVHDRRQLRQDGQACELACLRSRARACGAAARARASTLHLVAFLKKNDSESAERRQSAPSARTFHHPPPSARRSRASHPRATERLLQRAMLTQQHTL
eukprot:Tamp_26997.p2 GENE.Tamp_26997~~Tamp_26997.p2  ORF type:complete len:112 (-),score=5.79 Tamp_26997:386-721(-)